MKRYEFKNKLKELNKNNIAITGHMGSGKSAIGKIIAKYCGFKHFDSDKEITILTNKSINNIFKENGEKYFRNIERKVLVPLIMKKNIVISMGGGSVTNELIRKKLNKYSITVFLDVSINILEKRLKNSINRPLLKNVNLREKVKELDTARRKYYLLSDIILNNNDIAPINVYQNFLKEFSNYYEKTNSNIN